MDRISHSLKFVCFTSLDEKIDTELGSLSNVCSISVTLNLPVFKRVP